MSKQADSNPADFQQNGLQQSKLQDELEALRAEYREFVYAVSHDLTGPFRHLEGFTNIILSKNSDNLDDETKRYFELIIGGTDKGKAILVSLLSYSRITTTDIAQDTVHCEKIIECVLDDLSSLIETTGAEIQFTSISNPGTNICVVHGDETQLRHLFYHIIHNALHYRSTKNSPMVSIEALDLEREWQFSITDNGIGIRDKVAEKIFTPLKRGVPEIDYPGIGMGLTIAKSVVQRHGGKIWLTSEPGSGSSFSFTLSKENRSA